MTPRGVLKKNRQILNSGKKNENRLKMKNTKKKNEKFLIFIQKWKTLYCLQLVYMGLSFRIQAYPTSLYYQIKYEIKSKFLKNVIQIIKTGVLNILLLIIF